MQSTNTKFGSAAPKRTGRGPCLGLLLLCLGACLAPAPPIVVNTPYGRVRAESQASAEGVAQMLIQLAPRVQELLPGSQERSIEVWVQERLQVYRYQDRPESVRGFTLLSGEFEARRIHLQEDEPSPWYLSHELVHALIDNSWQTLPGILEEGLADVIAEQLNPKEGTHIRAHRLMNASAFSGGLRVELIYQESSTQTLGPKHSRIRSANLRLSDPVPIEMIVQLLSTPRAELHAKWDALPESFYGLAWLIVSRIGIEPLHALCQRAEVEGLALVPSSWLLEAAQLDLAEFTPAFISSCFSQMEFKHAIFLQPEAFAAAVIQILEPVSASLQPELYFPVARPAFQLSNGSQIPLDTTGPMMEHLMLHWPRR